MLPTTPTARPFSLSRRLGKFALFLTKGHAPGLAWWLAVHDAPRHQDYRSVPLAALAAAVQADPSWADLAVTGNGIESRALGLAFVGDDSVNRGYLTWLGLAHLGWKFTRRDGGGLLARHGTLTLNLSTDEECDMIREIHLSPRCYDLRFSGDWHVIDVGANVGMAALFFAQQPWCRKVISYEPFAPTAAAFEANVALNPALADKITLVRQALGEKADTLTVDYNPELRGSMSLTGLGAWREGAAAAPQRVTISVERITKALAPVVAGLGSCRLLGKIDCEGSEYGIFRDLAASGALDRFSAFVIEWHGEGPAALLDTLLHHGFATYVMPLSSDHHTLGLIYATRLGLSPAR